MTATTMVAPSPRSEALVKAQYIGDLLGDIHESTVRQYRRDGILPGRKYGRLARFSVEKIEDAVARMRTGGDSIIDLRREPLRRWADIAVLLDVKTSTVEAWARSRLVPRVKIGRHLRFIVEDVLAAAGRL